jgi:hypothetical protein
MKRVWKRRCFWLAGVAFAGGLAVVALCWWYRVWSLDGWRVYQAMSHECHPAWRDFHLGRVRAGDPVEAVIAKTEPTAVERKGRWVVLSYHKGGAGEGIHFTGMTAAAYDARMVCAFAHSCTWTRLFFDDLSDEQSQEFLGRPRDDPLRWGIAVVVR